MHCRLKSADCNNTYIGHSNQDKCIHDKNCTHFHSYSHWSHLNSHTCRFLYPGSLHSDTIEYKLCGRKQEHSIVTIVPFPPLTRGPSIITNDQCHNCLPNRTNYRCVLIPARDTMARIPQCLAAIHNSFQGRKYTLTSTGVPTVTICTVTCTGWFTACSSILTHPSTCCNSEKISSKAGGSIH